MRIGIQSQGNLGSQMVQLLLAIWVKETACVPVEIVGYSIPEFELMSALPSDFSKRSLSFRGRHVEPAMLRRYADYGLIEDFRLDRVVMRSTCFPCVESARKVFAKRYECTHIPSDNELIINVRGDEILNNRHSGYGPIPLAYYRMLIEETGLKPVFMGQLGADWYSELLRRHFPDAEFLQSGGKMSDFETLRRARNVVLSVSSFSYLGGWLSEADTIFLPVLGSFDPRLRPDIDAIPRADKRFRYHLFPQRLWNASDAQKAELEKEMIIPEVTASELAVLLAKARRNHGYDALVQDVKFLTRVVWYYSKRRLKT